MVGGGVGGKGNKESVLSGRNKEKKEGKYFGSG